MPNIETSERIGGAAFLSVPAMESFIWLLDNYARIELLVNLHNQLPAFLTSPVMSFSCLCIGLGLLYLSHARQLKRVGANAERRLVDTSGVEYNQTEKPAWMIPVCIGFAVALVATPLLALSYSLTYKGTSPKGPTIHPPLIAYLKTPVPPRPVQSPPSTNPPQSGTHNIQTGPITTTGTCSPVQIGSGTQNTECAPPTRSINAEDRTSLVADLSNNKAKAAVRCVSSDKESCDFGAQIYGILIDAGWELTDNIVRPVIPVMGGKFLPGVSIGFHGTEPGNRVIEIPDFEARVISALSKAHVKGLYVDRTPKIAEGTIEFLIAENPESAPNPK